MISLKKYSLLIFTACLLTACANRATFEWITINPDKIKEAKTRVVYRGGIRNIDLTLDLKEKTTPIYYESPEAFEAGNVTPLVVTKPKTVAKPNVKKNVVVKPFVNINKSITTKPAYVKPVAAKKTEANKTTLPKKIVGSKTVKATDSVVPNEENIALDKLNGALKIPKKTPQNIPIEQKQATQPERNSVKKTSLEDKKTVLIKPSGEFTVKKQQNVEKTLTHSSIQQTDDVTKFLNAKKGNNFILAGASLAVIGVVLGLIFGKSAYLVSGAGVLFAIIGLILKF